MRRGLRGKIENRGKEKFEMGGGGGIEDFLERAEKESLESGELLFERRLFR